MNPKFYVMVTAVFAQFIDADANNAVLVVLGFVIMLLIAHLGWLGVGSLLTEALQGGQYLGVLNKVMGASLFGVAGYFLFRV